MTKPIDLPTPDLFTPAPASARHAPPPAAPSFAEQFAYCARHECGEEPLYVAYSAAVAADPRRAGLLAAAPATQARPMLWFAALHDRVLELVASGARPPLAAYYASVGGTRAPDDALAATLDAFLDGERAALRERIATRGTQTNEIARCAALAPLLSQVSADAGGRPIALLDVGCSAGLNLGVDRYRYRYLDAVDDRVLAHWPVAADDDDAPVIDARVIGPGPVPLPASGGLSIASRLGLDIAPVDAGDERELRWLRACLWPSNVARRARFDAAVAIARRERWTVRRVDDVTGAIDDWLASLPRDVTPVVFNSWVLFYFGAAALERHLRLLKRRAAEGRLAWISAEMARVVRPAWPALPEPGEAEFAAGARAGLAAHDLADATMWTIARPGAVAGGVDWRLAARSHGHARWVQFVAGPGAEAPAR